MYVPKHFAATDDQVDGLLNGPVAGDLAAADAVRNSKGEQHR